MSNLKVLVAEQDSKVLFAFSKVLEKEGWICIQSSNIGQALKEFLHSKPNAVFLDVSRSEGEYDTLFKKIAEKQLSVPLVIISSHITQEIKALAAGIGALQVIEKPLRLDSVRQCLDRIKEKLIEK